jgi:FdhD protein
MTSTETIRRTRFENGIEKVHEDWLAIEEPLEIRLNGQALSITMRTPGNDLDLTRGFLITEQIVSTPAQILDLEVISENIVSAQVPPEILQKKCWVRNFYASSSCGVCGKSSIDQLKIHSPVIQSDFSISRSQFLQVPNQMRGSQQLFERTGGLHAAVLFNSEGGMLALREDVGRHNAVDKVIGWAASAMGLPIREAGLFVSGRTSFEILQKAIAAGIPLVGAVSAPSSLAVRLAREYHVTLAGFVRGDTFNLYSDHGQIRG